MVCGNVKESQAPVQVTCDKNCGTANIAVHHAALPQERKSLSCLPQTQRQVHAPLFPRKLNLVHECRQRCNGLGDQVYGDLGPHFLLASPLERQDPRVLGLRTRQRVFYPCTSLDWARAKYSLALQSREIVLTLWLEKRTVRNLFTPLRAPSTAIVSDLFTASLNRDTGFLSAFAMARKCSHCPQHSPCFSPTVYGNEKPPDIRDVK